MAEPGDLTSGTRGGDAPTGAVAFVLRVVRDDRGRLKGIIERLRTGQKERFDDGAAIGDLISRMIGDLPRADRDTYPPDT